MGESILAGRSSKTKISTILITEVITTNTNWTVPSIMINNMVSIRLFGGGSGGYGNNELDGRGGWDTEPLDMVMEETPDIMDLVGPA